MSNVLDFTSPRGPERAHSQPLPPGGGGGTYDPMEARVAKLEDDMKEVRSDLKAIRIDLAELKGRVASLPTTWQMITLVFGILGGAFLILRFGIPALSP